MNEADRKRRASDNSRTQFAILFLGAALAGLLITVVVLTLDVRNYTDQNRDNAIASCEQANESRQILVKNYRQEVVRLQLSRAAEWADIAELRRLGVSDRALERHADNARGYTKNIAQKRRTIRDTLEAVADTAIEPGSPIKDCEQANPK